jgi:hypothetical protein
LPRRGSKGRDIQGARRHPCLSFVAFLDDEAASADDKVLARDLKPDLLLIDDMGIKQLPKRSGEYLLEISPRRYDTRSTIITLNRPLEGWRKLIGDVVSPTAIVNRILHHVVIVQITDQRYPLRQPGLSPGSEGEGKVSDSGSEEGTPASKPARAPTSSLEGKRARSYHGPRGIKTGQGAHRLGKAIAERAIKSEGLVLTIQPQYLTLAKLFDGRLFQIPEYQRAYSWTSHQRDDLFNDIRKTAGKGPDAGHFMAAIVCLRRKKQNLGTDEFHVLDVVDGQQRLTTVIILLNAIKLALDKKERAHAKLAAELGELLVKSEGDELLLLQTNHDSSHYFTNYLRKGLAPGSATGKTLADREVLEAIEECGQFVSDWQAKGHSLLSLTTLLKNRLFFLLHEIDDEKTVYTVFEVLNSRGLDVSWLDRLKSILMGSAFELKKANSEGVIDDLHTTWRDIYSVIGLRQGMSTEALRFAATLRIGETPSKPLGEEASVEALRSEATNAKKIRDVASWLLRVTQACDEVVANVRINAVTRISQARLLATAIHLREDIKKADRGDLLKRWEKVSFRIYGMLGHDARTRVGDYVRLAWQVVNEKLSVSEIDSGVREIGDEFSIKEAVDYLYQDNCYEGWENELRYLLFRYEEHLAKSQKLNFSNEQWEKIWMVSPADSIEVLLPPKLNSKLQDLDPEDKAEEYRKTGLLIARQVADMIESDGWNKQAIENRENAILEWAAKEWAD